MSVILVGLRSLREHAAIVTRANDALCVFHVCLSWSDWAASLILVMERSSAAWRLKSYNLFLRHISPGWILCRCSLRLARSYLWVAIGIELLLLSAEWIRNSSLSGHFLACSSSKSWFLSILVRMVVLITLSKVIWLKMTFILSLDIIEENFFIFISSWEMRSIVHFIERDLLESSVIHLFLVFSLVVQRLIHHLTGTILWFNLKIILLSWVRLYKFMTVILIWRI